MDGAPADADVRAHDASRRRPALIRRFRALVDGGRGRGGHQVLTAMLIDAHGYERQAGSRYYVRIALRTIALDQLIALPVSLIMTSAGIPFGKSYLIASIYSQSIGALCAIATTLFLARL